jgi:hypothetical protein
MKSTFFCEKHSKSVHFLNNIKVVYLSIIP